LLFAHPFVYFSPLTSTPCSMHRSIPLLIATKCFTSLGSSVFGLWYRESVCVYATIIFLFGRWHGVGTFVRSVCLESWYHWVGFCGLVDGSFLFYFSLTFLPSFIIGFSFLRSSIPESPSFSSLLVVMASPLFFARVRMHYW